MNHFAKNHDISRGLHNLVVPVISCRHHWRSRTRHDDAARANRHVLNGVRSCPHSFPLSSAVGLPLQSLRRGGRNSSILWVANTGFGQLRCASRLAPVVTKLSETLA